LLVGYAKYFFEAIKRVTVQVPDDLHRRLKYLSVDKDTTMQKIFLEAVKLYVQDNDFTTLTDNI
jgi:predicted transcriptional regulator